MMLFGTYHLKLDGKGRMRVPSDLLGQMNLDQRSAADDEDSGQEEERYLYLAPGFEGTLRMFSESMMEDYLKKFNHLNPAIPEQRRQLRRAHMGIKRVKIDNADRITLPKELTQNYAQFSSAEITVYAYLDIIEIWDTARFREEEEELNPETYSEVQKESDELKQGINQNDEAQK